MDFRLIDSDWKRLLMQEIANARHEIRIISPFIKGVAAKDFLGRRRIRPLVITRFNLGDFYQGVSDIEALKFLLKRGGDIKGVRNLHAKAYIFDDRCAVVTSANLTSAGITRNQELGFVTHEPSLIAICKEYFNRLWNAAGDPITSETVQAWEAKLDETHRRAGRHQRRPRLPDYGAELGYASDLISASPNGLQPLEADAFIKFLGTSKNRAESSLPVLEEVKRAGCHWALAYPLNRRPRQVPDGAIMFIARLVHNDTLIFGRAIGTKHKPGRDDATPDEITARPWKARWPHYIRVRDGKFVAGPLENGVSLNQMISKLGPKAFEITSKAPVTASTYRNPRLVLMRRAAIKLSTEGAAWLARELDKKFLAHGCLTEEQLSSID